MAYTWVGEQAGASPPMRSPRALDKLVWQKGQSAFFGRSYGDGVPRVGTNDAAPLTNDSLTLRSGPLLAEQPPREAQREHALPGIRLVPRAGNEDLRKRVPGGQKRREPPLERRFGADVVSRLNPPFGFETHDLLKFRNQKGNMHTDESRSEPRSLHVSSDVGAHSHMPQCEHQR